MGEADKRSEPTSAKTFPHADLVLRQLEVAFADAQKTRGPPDGQAGETDDIPMTLAGAHRVPDAMSFSPPAQPTPYIVSNPRQPTAEGNARPEDEPPAAQADHFPDKIWAASTKIPASPATMSPGRRQTRSEGRTRRPLVEQRCSPQNPAPNRDRAARSRIPEARTAAERESNRP